MSFMFTVSPDFSPVHLSGWYIFNTWLQKQTDLALHLELYDDFHTQTEAIKSDSIDLIYANSFDAAMLMRDKGFLPLPPHIIRMIALLVVHRATKVYCKLHIDLYYIWPVLQENNPSLWCAKMLRESTSFL